MGKKKRCAGNGLTINVRSLCKSLTKMNVSADVLSEYKNYIEEVLTPKIVLLAERYAKSEGKNTIQERDYLRARDYINVALSQV